MACPWYKIKNNICKNKESLRSLSVGILFFALLLFHTIFSNTSLCLSQRLFHTPCIGCGMSRAFLSILKFDFSKALQYNFLSIPLFFGIILYVVFLFADLLFFTNLRKKLAALLSHPLSLTLYIILILTKFILT